ncbi:hypothetical protein G6O69_28155 [Pseudenhygromyxa sp. WMMC2535]|uniref:hypothetical protein n=1 Tax=Pseudenhygromyxa sp. WMMC2535 TaxID=2712867 RepID=UPI0015551E4C|nr:hypothetical protein [Pseudenhygromyxa sp. WMMC2535]NVB41740.1 hypothetical protein [Pseudenhygromyxa sp. WMMC2535]
MSRIDHEEHIDDIAEDLREHIYRLPYSQAGVNGRHRCPVCAYRRGIEDAVAAMRAGRLDDFLARAGVIEAGPGRCDPGR